MNKILELREKRAKLLDSTKIFLENHRLDNGLLSIEDQTIYEKMEADVLALGREIERLERQNAIYREINKPKWQKPPRGIKPYYIAAWQRIGELIEAIKRQYESADGDAGLVEKWANEISWQASMIEALRGGQDEQPKQEKCE